MEIYILILMVLVAFLGTAFTIGLLEHTPADESLRKAADLWRRWIKKAWDWLFSQPAPCYLVHVGYDGFRLLPQIVDQEMKAFRESFPVCYCEDIQNQTDAISYVFKIHFTELEPEDMREFLGLAQKKAEACLSGHMRQYGCHVPAEPLTAVSLRNDYVQVTFAKNQAGMEEVERLKRQEHDWLRSKEIPPLRSEPFLERWEAKEATGKMVWGYEGEPWREHGAALPVRTAIRSHPHALLTGSSGSGKSMALLFLLGKILQADSEIVVYLCDFKKSDDFKFLEPYPHYYAGDDCPQGVLDYYERFCQARRDGEKTRRHVLIFDEYPAFVSYLQGRDKREKTKQANEVMAAIAEILMLGRGTGGGFGCWLVTQRADANLFANGARDNFMTVIALGRLSKEQKGMVFPGEETPERIFQAGEGLMLADGKELIEVKYPLFVDEAGWKNEILSNLMRSPGVHAGSEA